jgi:hypothetical protein
MSSWRASRWLQEAWSTNGGLEKGIDQGLPMALQGVWGEIVVYFIWLALFQGENKLCWLS